jgi:hypothetical protein
MPLMPPDRLAMRILWMLAVLGASLCVIGWYRYFS